MKWSWLQSLIYGLLSGFTEFLPVSSEAHRVLFLKLSGAGDESVAFQLVCHVSILIALLLSCRQQLARLRRERKIASIPSKRRKRQPDIRSLLDLRIIKTASIPLLLSFILYLPAAKHTDRLWLLAAILAANGVILQIPLFLPRGNKDSQSMSALDALLVGLGGALAAIPGISRVGSMISVSQMRGGDRQYALDISLLLCIPALIVLSVFDVFILFSTAAALSAKLILHYILAAAAAFLSAYFSIILMRFLAVKTGFSGFAYYCWGTALFAFILYLTI